jgi:hypothetical protein
MVDSRSGARHTMVDSRGDDDTPWSAVGVETICHGRQSECRRHTMVDSRSEGDMSWSTVGVGHDTPLSAVRVGDDTAWSIVGVQTTDDSRQSECRRHTTVDSRGDDDTPWSAVGVETICRGRP